MKLEKINIENKLSTFSDYWNPKIVGELNSKYVKFKGEFVWHKHDGEDEMFQVIKGEFKMEFRDKNNYIKRKRIYYCSKRSRAQASGRE